jgi:hypothetical protein
MLRDRFMGLLIGRNIGLGVMIKWNLESKSHFSSREIITSELAVLIYRRPNGGEDIDHLGLLGTSGMSMSSRLFSYSIRSVD